MFIVLPIIDESLIHNHHFPVLLKAYPNAMTSPWVNGWNCVWEQKYNLQTTPITVEANCASDPSQKNGQAMVDTNTSEILDHFSLSNL